MTNKDDMPDVIVKLKTRIELATISGNESNLKFYNEIQSHIDELTQKSEAELKAQREAMTKAFIKRWDELTESSLLNDAKAGDLLKVILNSKRR